MSLTAAPATREEAGALRSAEVEKRERKSWLAQVARRLQFNDAVAALLWRVRAAVGSCEVEASCEAELAPRETARMLRYMTIDHKLARRRR